MTLDDEHWAWVKRQREALVGWQCEWVGCVEPHYDGHHKTYVHKGREWVEDIELLCRAHHDKIHFEEHYPDQLTFDELELPHVIRIEDAVPDNVVDFNDLKVRRLTREWKEHANRLTAKEVQALTTPQLRVLLCHYVSREAMEFAFEADDYNPGLASIEEWIHVYVEGTRRIS